MSAAPTLNSPANSSETTDTTPTFDFTGTAPDGHALEYEIQIGLSSSWSNDVVGSAFYIDGHTSLEDTTGEWSNDANAVDGSTATLAACTASVADTSFLNAIGSTCSLTDSDGCFKSMDFRAWGDEAAGAGVLQIDVIISGTTFLVNNIQHGTTPAWTAYSVPSEPFLPGVGRLTWSAITDSLRFRAYPSVAGALMHLGKVEVRPTYQPDLVIYSNSLYLGSEFVNPDNGSDTHPFNSGENIRWTPPNPLYPGIFYWRVRCRDASASEIAWSDWSETRSINIVPAAPTLNSPSDSSSTSDTTPTFDFTGTGLGGSMEYEIGISETELVTKAIVEQQGPSGNSSEPLNTTYKGVGQAFTGNGSYLESIQWALRRASSPTGTLTVKVYAHSGTFGTDSVPTGSPLAVSEDTMDVSTLATVETYYTFSFSGVDQIFLEDGVHYIATAEYSEAVSINHVTVKDVIGGSLEGTQSRQKQSDSLWEFTGTLSSAFVITINGKPLIYAQSELGHAGFVNPDVSGGR